MGLMSYEKYSNDQLRRLSEKSARETAAIREKRRRLFKKEDHPNGISQSVKISVVVENIKAYGDLTCDYCKKKISPCRVHFDHIVPKIKGGKSIIENISIACQRCNSSKRDKDVVDFINDLKKRGFICSES